jgi:hypothetical protein
MSNFYKFLITAVAVVAALYFIVLPLGIRGLAYYLHHKAVNSPERVVSFPVPDTSATLTFYSRHNHAFMAEYKRRFTLEQPGQPIIEKEMEWDTGGRDWAAVYGVKYRDQMKVFVVDGWSSSNTTSTVENRADDPSSSAIAMSISAQMFLHIRMRKPRQQCSLVL